MVNGALQEVMRQVIVLSFDEKLTLAGFLIEQLKLDAASKPTGESPTNGRQQAEPDQRATQEAAQGGAPDPRRRREMRWIEEHRDEYAGQYVALDGDRLIAHGPDGRQVLAEARKAGMTIPFVARIESADEPPFGGW